MYKEPAKSEENNSLIDFETSFLKEAKIKDRRQMYISGELYEKISGYVHLISDGNVSMVGYVNNILEYHIREYRNTINEIYQIKINKGNPL
jgi:hypothetical protein